MKFCKQKKKLYKKKLITLFRTVQFAPSKCQTQFLELYSIISQQIIQLYFDCRTEGKFFHYRGKIRDGNREFSFLSDISSSSSVSAGALFYSEYLTNCLYFDDCPQLSVETLNIIGILRTQNTTFSLCKQLSNFLKQSCPRAILHLRCNPVRQMNFSRIV